MIIPCGPSALIVNVLALLLVTPDPCERLAGFLEATRQSGEVLQLPEALSWANLLTTAVESEPTSTCAQDARAKALMLFAQHQRWDDAIAVADAGLSHAPAGPERVRFANYAVSMRVFRAGNVGNVQTPAVVQDCLPIATAGLEAAPTLQSLIDTGKFEETASLVPLRHVIVTASPTDAPLLELARDCIAVNAAARAAGAREPLIFDVFSIARELLLRRLALPTAPADSQLTECIDLVSWSAPTLQDAGTLVLSLIRVEHLPFENRVALVRVGVQRASNAGWRARLEQALFSRRLASGIPASTEERLALFADAESIRLQIEALAEGLAPGAVPEGFTEITHWETVKRAAYMHAADLGLDRLGRCDLGAPAARAFIALYPDDSTSARLSRLLENCP